MDDDEVTAAYDDTDSNADVGETWLAEQARLVLLEDGA